jgi:hypothetical protein
MCRTAAFASFLVSLAIAASQAEEEPYPEAAWRSSNNDRRNTGPRARPMTAGPSGHESFAARGTQ